jgi:hypothetical protein
VEYCAAAALLDGQVVIDTFTDQRAVYLHTADNYHRLTWPIFTGSKRPR